MAISRKESSVTASSPTAVDNNTITSSRPSQQTSAMSFLKRKPVKAPTAATSTSSSSPSSPSSSSSLTVSNSKNALTKTTSTQSSQSISKMMGPPSVPTLQTDMIYSQTQRSLPLTDAAGMGMGLGFGANQIETPRTPKTFQQSQDELFSKLEALAAVKARSNPTETPKQGRPSMGGQQMNNRSQSNISDNNGYTNNNIINNNRGSGILGNQGISSSPSQRLQSLRFPIVAQPGIRNGISTNSNGSGSSAPERPREPRRQINSAQFKTPSAADMAELAQTVVANANPPKAQNKTRKKPSTLSLTTTTYIHSGNQNPSIVANTPGGGGLTHVGESDYQYRYEAAVKEIKNLEKIYSSVQHQIHYERERWEEKYGLLEKAFKDLENNRVEANVEKMNSLLDTVQQLQIANETFRRQLMDAGIEPDPEPATQFHSHQLLVGENMDRTFLEQNEVMKEQSLITNQKISHLSSELNNVAIAISQTINYVQLRYLTQMLDAAEHVTSQKRSRAMSNSFLSDMLSRGVKKAGPLQPKNTTTSATQTPPTLLSALQLQQQERFQQEFMQQHLAFRPLETKFSKSFSFSNGLLSLAGLSHGDNGDVSKGMQYRLRGQLMDDRSQLDRSGITLGLMNELKGRPTSPNSAEIQAASRCSTPATKFQYSSPTTSQLRIVVPDSNLLMTPSMASGSLHSAEGSLRRSASDASVGHSLQQQTLVRASGKYPHPYTHSSRTSLSSVKETDLHRPMSQQFLSPDMANLYNNNVSSMAYTPPVGITTNNRFLSASNILHEST